MAQVEHLSRIYVCLSVCTDNNFRTKWSLTYIFGMLVHLNSIDVKVIIGQRISRS